MSEIDIDATRTANADVPDDPRRGTLSIAGPAANQAPQVDQNGEAEAEAPKVQTVTVYSATWCGYCKDLKRYLASRNIPASIIEVDLLPAEGQHSATATMKRLTGRIAYPTVWSSAAMPRLDSRGPGSRLGWPADRSPAQEEGAGPVTRSR